MIISNRRNFLKSAALPLLAPLPGMQPHISSNHERAIPIIEAHRGVSDPFPENTQIAIEKALEAKADRVEIDLRLSKDKKMVIMHDNTVDRTTDGTGMVSNLSWDVLKKMDAGASRNGLYGKQRIMLLEDVFELCKGKAMVNIDLKDTNAVGPMLKLAKKMDMTHEIVITGAIPAAVHDIRKQGQNITMFYEVTDTVARHIQKNEYIKAIQLAIQEAIQWQLPGFLFNNDWVTQPIIYYAHRHGLSVNVYHVNTVDRAKELSAWRVDGIMTNEPKKIMEGLRSN